MAGRAGAIRARLDPCRSTRGTGHLQPRRALHDRRRAGPAHAIFRGITTVTALGLLAELGDLRRFASARELMSYLGLTPSEYSSGDQHHRGHITKTGPRHARRLLIEAAW